MKQIILKLAALVLLPTVLLTFTSCSTTSGVEEEIIITSDQGVIIVDTIKASATVTAIDAATRKVTLMKENGKSTTVTCGPAVRNFSQIAINDRVTVTMTEELSVFLGTGATPSASGAAVAARAPLGDKPGGVIASSVEITAQITALDTKTRKVTLALPDGTSKVVKVGNKVDLTGVKPGDNVTVQRTEALAITVEKL